MEYKAEIYEQAINRSKRSEQDFTAIEEATIRSMFKDPGFNPEEFKRVLLKHGFKRKNSMRNQPCPCESGKKTKNCCWNRLPK